MTDHIKAVDYVELRRDGRRALAMLQIHPKEVDVKTEAAKVGQWVSALQETLARLEWQRNNLKEERCPECSHLKEDGHEESCGVKGLLTPVTL